MQRIRSFNECSTLYLPGVNYNLIEFHPPGRRTAVEKSLHFTNVHNMKQIYTIGQFMVKIRVYSVSNFGVIECIDGQDMVVNLARLGVKLQRDVG